LFYPILEIEEFEGFTNVFNFPPNNWELKKKYVRKKFLNLTWIEQGRWITRNIAEVKVNERFEITKKDVLKITNTSNFKLLSLTDEFIDEKNEKLPNINDKFLTKNPSWRASIGLKLGDAITSYQGEIYPFPNKGSTLSLCPFLQFDKENIKNLLVFLNLESNPVFRKCNLGIYESNKKKLIKNETVFSNKINIIDLNNISYDHEKSYLIIKTDNILGVPLYVSYSLIDNSLSIEHTHPPGSFSLLGDRRKIQNYIKQNFDDI